MADNTFTLAKGVIKLTRKPAKLGADYSMANRISTWREVAGDVTNASSRY